MLFAVTHFDAAGHRHKARVGARDWHDALGQMEAVFGVARGASCMRVAPKPVLCVVRGGRAGGAAKVHGFELMGSAA